MVWLSRFGYALRKTHSQTHPKFKTLLLRAQVRLSRPWWGREPAWREQKEKDTSPALRLRLAQTHPTGRKFHATCLLVLLDGQRDCWTITPALRHSGIFRKRTTNGQKARRRGSASPLRLRLAGDTFPDTSQGKKAARKRLWIVWKNNSPLFHDNLAPGQNSISDRLPISIVEALRGRLSD